LAVTVRWGHNKEVPSGFAWVYKLISHKPTIIRRMYEEVELI